MRKTEEYNITFSDDNQVVKKQRVKKDKMNVFEVFGAIVGKALYLGKVDLKEAIEVAK